MYQNLPHQIGMRDSEDEPICARCGLLNPGEDDPCLSISVEAAEAKPEYMSAAEPMPERKAA
jgi:hypothetical protein